MPCPGSYGPKLKIHVGNWALALSVISTLWSQASYFQQFNKSAWITKWIGVTTRRSLYGQKRFKTLYTAWSIERRSELTMRSNSLGIRKTFEGKIPSYAAQYILFRRVSSECFASLNWFMGHLGRAICTLHLVTAQANQKGVKSTKVCAYWIYLFFFFWITKLTTI